MPQAELRATYASPHNAPLSLATPLDLPATTTSFSSSTSPSPAEKAAYLRDLRAATAALQVRINGELTARMEEDKAREASAAAGGGGVAAAVAGTDKGKGGKAGSGGGSGGGAEKAAEDVDEDAEEENYGEEAVEDD
ncbi:hypothetical protein DL767_007846 [Monosporascus sp. MG133]|nr:hypothetical protein DL767_007846 [Monosporascus sp. MG133]